MRNPLLSHSIRCITCGATRRGYGLTRIRATARRDGWVRSNGHDYCAACITAKTAVTISKEN